MKQWLLYILLFITAAGTFVPCCAVDDCCADQLVTQNNEEHEDEGSCSPFFACATCPGFTALTKPLPLLQPLAPMQIHHEQASSFNYTAYVNSFWQPPRHC